jgi:hypothetical protein
MGRRRKLRLAKQQLRQNGSGMPGDAKQQSLRNGKYEAREEEKLPTKEKEITNSKALQENKTAAAQSRKHRQRRKESFEWAANGVDKKARQENIKNTGIGKHQSKISFTLIPGDMARVNRNIGYEAWPGYIPKDSIGVIVSEPEREHVAFLFAGMTMQVPIKALRPLNWEDDEEE